MYDFDEAIDRRQTNSMKWGQAKLFLTPEQCAADPLPMWVADMDFRVAPVILEALRDQIDMGVLGYGGTPDSYREAAVAWQARRFGWQAQPEWLVQSPGVISALNMAIQAFSQPGDHVLVQTGLLPFSTRCRLQRPPSRPGATDAGGGPLPLRS